MTRFELVDGDHLDFDAFIDLQREAYADYLKNLKISNAYMTTEFYRWKFHPPAAPAKIAFVWEDDRMVAANAMIPLDMRLGKDFLRGWQSCDTATLPKARGKGYFQGCLITLKESLKPDEIFFGFPNQTSYKGIYNMGCREKGTVTTWIYPAASIKGRSSPNISIIFEFDKDHDYFAQRLADFGKVMLWRSADYLNWRYTRHPINNYVIFVYRKDDELLGFAVVRSADAIGRKISVVMELWGLQRLVSKTLLQNIAKWSVEQGNKDIVFQDSGLSLFKGVRIGLVAVPHQFLPKKQVLMCYATPGRLSETMIRSDWRVQLGDWDVF